MDERITPDEIETDSVDPSIRDKLWLIRRCTWYESEYKDCKSPRARGHQYFIYGELLDCSQWMRDTANCYRWRDKRDVTSAKELIDVELKRRRDRLTPFLHNEVWENRTEPPENWNDPLPEWMQKEHETSYLAQRQKMDRENESSGPLGNRQSLCTIM